MSGPETLVGASLWNRTGLPRSPLPAAFHPRGTRGLLEWRECLGHVGHSPAPGAFTRRPAGDTTTVIFTMHTWGGDHRADSAGGAGEWSPSSWRRWHQAPFLAQHWLWWPWGPARGQASAPQGRGRRTASARVLGCGCRRTESENVFVLPPAQ